MRPLRLLVAPLSWGVLAATAVAGQIPPPPPTGPPPQVEREGPALLESSVDTLDVDGSVSPLGAFLRAIAVPGWGHAAVGSHGRGGFYLTTQAATGYMLVRTRSRLNDAKALRAVRENQIRGDLVAGGVTDETVILAALESDDGWAGANRLVDARQQQFEDWLALGIFTVLLSGADALVSAHLQDFPDVSATPVGDEGRMEVRVRVPVGGR